MTIEVCIVFPSAAQNGYMMDVYLWNGNAKLCSTEQIDSFYVSLTSEEPSDEAECDDCVQTQALAMTQEDGTMNLLPSKLQSMLKADQQERPYTTEYFEVPFETEYGNAIVLYAQAANVEVYRRYLVCAA